MLRSSRQKQLSGREYDRLGDLSQCSGYLLNSSVLAWGSRQSLPEQLQASDIGEFCIMFRKLLPRRRFSESPIACKPLAKAARRLHAALNWQNSKTRAATPASQTRRAAATSWRSDDRD